MSKGTVNKSIIIGNLGKDIDLRYTPNGKATCTFSLATTESYKGQDKTEWHRCVAWEKQAEFLNSYAKKGSKIYVDGKIQTRSYEQSGVVKYSTEIIVRNVEILDRGKTSTEEHEQPEHNVDELPF